jgi:uncharacterized protein (DUF2267 family)
MITSTLAAFDNAVHSANTWIKDLAEELGDPDDKYRAYHAMRAVLHALRDRLTVEEAADLAAQLPMLVRGFYFDGWHPANKPLRERSRQQFLSHVASAFPTDIYTDPAYVTRAVFAVLSRHVTPGEIDDVKNSLPEEIRGLWA